MRNISGFLRRFLGDDNGPTAVEYAVMLSMIVAVCMGGIRTLGTNLSTSFTNTATSLGSGGGGGSSGSSGGSSGSSGGSSSSSSGGKGGKGGKGGGGKKSGS
jgi:pilus assembly protein Flp/PilA